MPKSLVLTQNKRTIIDDEDFEKVSKYKWFAKNHSGKYYALHSLPREGSTRKALRLHRFIMNAGPEDVVDHINGDTLDNRKINLRLCSQAENSRNRTKTKSNTSGFKGVRFHKRTKKWEARIGFNYKLHYLGLFDKIEEATKAYDAACKQLHREFASLNNETKNLKKKDER